VYSELPHRALIRFNKLENVMRKRKAWLIVILLIVTGLAAAWRFPASIYVPMGVLRREAFYDGKPTSYWARAFKKEPFLGQALPAGDTGKTLREGGAAAVPVLCEILKSPDPDLRMDALLGLSLIGTDAKPAEPALAEAVMQEKQPSRFVLAGQTLGKLDPEAAADTLTKVLRDRSDASRQSWALSVLLDLAPECQAALPALAEIAHNPAEDARLRVAAVRVLWRLHQPAEPLVASLCDTLAAQDTPAGVQALEALGEMGPAAKPAVPALVKILARPSLPAVGLPYGPPHRMAVVGTLGKIGLPAEPAIPALIASLNSGDGNVRVEAALALSLVGPMARKQLAARDATWAASLVLLAATYPAHLAAPPVLEVFRRTWIPADLPSREKIRAAIAKIDPGARARTKAPSFSGH
jgi:HEAT repeat protein